MRAVDAVIVVPCYNEARRLDEAALIDLAAPGQVRLFLVDDGSTDETRTVLRRIERATEGRARVLVSDVNGGKAEAVRKGLVAALEDGAPIVGYYDADLATPPDELLRLLGVLQNDADLAVVIGSRVAVLGSRIERSAVRHYTGRVYATIASLALGITVYDTQCGAKVFRANDTLAAAVAAPFGTSWTFDVELLQRLLVGMHGAPGLALAALREEPVTAWRDVPGTKVRLVDGIRALIDLGRVWADRRRAS